MKTILHLLLYRPHVYSGLDHFIVTSVEKAKDNGYETIVVFEESLEEQPQLAADLQTVGAIVEFVSANKKQRRKDVKNLYKKYHPAIVDCHFTKEVKLQSQFLSKRYGAKHITHVHSLLGPSIKEYRQRAGLLKCCLLRFNYWLQAKMSDQVICVSNAVLNQYREYAYGKHNNVQVLYLGTQLVGSTLSTHTHTRAGFDLPREAKIIANVSAIEPIKGIDLILQAVAKVKETEPNILFLHMGGLRSNTPEQREYAESIYQMVKDLGLENNVRFMGIRNDVADILPICDAYIHPSRSEAMSTAILEAAAAGLPLIGTNIGGIPEIVIDKQTGILCENENVEQLSEAIQECLSSKGKQYGIQAKKYVDTHFDQNTQVKKYIAEIIKKTKKKTSLWITGLLLIMAIVFGGLILTRHMTVPFFYRIKAGDSWTLATYTGNNPLQVDTTELNPIPFDIVPSHPQADFWADPFLVKEGDTYYVFYEYMPPQTNSTWGDVYVMSSKDFVHWKHEGCCVDERFHLSYPQVFKFDNQWFMLPSDGNDLRLYEATDFPKGWKYKTSIIDIIAHDPTIFEWNGVWYILANSVEGENLLLYYADSPLAEWTEHPCSPVRTAYNNVRPGGRPLVYEGKLYYFIQDYSGDYGTGLWAYEIDTLDKTMFADHRLEQPVLWKHGKDWAKDGMHHLSAIEENGEWKVVVDGKQRQDKVKYGWDWKNLPIFR